MTCCPCQSDTESTPPATWSGLEIDGSAITSSTFAGGSISGSSITGLPAPSSSGDAATKAYVDAQAASRVGLNTRVKLNSDLSIANGTETAVIWSAAAEDELNGWVAAVPHVLFVPSWATRSRVTMETRWKTGAGDNLGYRKVRIKTYGNAGEVWAVDFRTAVGADTADSTVSSAMISNAGINSTEGTFTAWAASTVYPLASPTNTTVGIASYLGVNYLCVVAHTSTSVFDPTKWKAGPAFYVTVQQSSGSPVLLRASATKFALESVE